MIEVIPAIDIIDGQCVRLSRGEYESSKVYHTDPVEVAKEFEAAGFRRLHLVDLDGARKGAVVNWAVLEKICSNTKLAVDFSGGISSAVQVQRAIGSGAEFISIGSVAVKQPGLFMEWVEQYGGGKFLLGADVRGEKVVVKGWTEDSGVNLYSLLDQYYAAGIRSVFCTDVSKDGMLEGPSIELYQQIIERYPGIGLIASGGVQSVADIDQLNAIGCSGVIIGKAFYEGRIKTTELKKYVD